MQRIAKTVTLAQNSQLIY